MSKYIEQLKRYLQTLVSLCARYSFVLFLLVFASMASFLVIRIGVLSSAEPSQTEIDQALSGIKPVKLDQTAIAKLKELEDKNISIEALFDNGRTNPFEN